MTDLELFAALVDPAAGVTIRSDVQIKANMVGKNWLIYGAYGYTGKLIAREAAARGLTPVLAGRRSEPLEELAAELGLTAVAFELDDAAALARQLEDVDVVLHCAGPFSQTAAPMIQACMTAGSHYLDITGEIDIFEMAHRQSGKAASAGVALVPGVGFDVVPTDCLAATLHAALPGATQLTLAFEAGGGPSRGTARTSVEGLGKGGRIRREGKLVEVPLAWKTRQIDFGDGPRCTMTIPWGDVYTAYVSTGIPSIEVYMSVPPATARRLRRMRWLRPVLGLGPVQRMLKKRVDRGREGPSEKARASTDSRIWGEVVDAQGQRRTARMITPNGYWLTAIAALGIVEHLLGAETQLAGYQTPSQLMGKDYAMSLPGVSVTLD